MATHFLANDLETHAAGARLADVLIPATRKEGRALVVFIRGELGTGKSTLVRGLLRHLGVRGVIPSPTYSLVEPYKIDDLNVLHMDAYRLSDAQELDYLGIDGAFNRCGLVLVEWPDQIAAALPAPDMQVRLDHLPGGSQGRQLTIIANQALTRLMATG